MAVWIMNNKKLGDWLRASGLKKLAVAPGFAFDNNLFENAKTEVVRQHPEETNPDSRAAYRLLTRNRPKMAPQPTIVYKPDVPKWLRITFAILVLGLLSVVAARSQTVIFRDEGVTRVRRAGGQVGVDFVGAGVSCGTSVAGITTCTISGGGATGYQTIQDEGTGLTQRTILNFIGAGVGCVDDVPSTRTDCTIPGGGSTTLDAILAAAGAATINSGDNAIVWNWSLTTAGKSALTFGENVASVAITDPILINIQTLVASTAHPLQVTARGTANGVRVDAATGVLTAIGSGGVTATTGDSATNFFSSGTLGVGIGGTGAGAFTLGSVVFAGASGVYTEDNTNFFWHDINNRLGIGTSAPDNPLSIVRTLNALADLAVEQNYHFKIQNTNDIDGQGVGIAFGMSSADDQQTVAIVARRTGSNGQGALQLYNKRSTATGVAPVLGLAIDENGNVVIGAETAPISAKLELSSTTGALLTTRMTTTQRDALTAVDGMILYNSTDAETQSRIAGAWENLSAGSGDTVEISILDSDAIPDTSGNVFSEPFTVAATNDNWRRLVWVFNDTGTARDCLHGGFNVPPDYNSSGTASFDVWWSSDINTGDVEWDFDYRGIATGESYDQATAIESLNVADTAPATDWLKQDAIMGITEANLAAGDDVEFFLCRDKSDAGDTLVGNGYLFRLIFSYTN